MSDIKHNWHKKDGISVTDVGNKHRVAWRAFFRKAKSTKPALSIEEMLRDKRQAPVCAEETRGIHSMEVTE